MRHDRDDDTTLRFPRDRTLGGANHPLRLPEWNDSQLAAVALRQAVVHDALVQLLIAKGVITLDELTESARASAAERLVTIMSDLPTFE